jgi:predicted nucleic acid-binding protein
VTGVLLDTSAIFASARPRSEWHAEAAAAYRALIVGTEWLVTTDLIVAELHALSIARVHPRFGLELVERLMASERIEVIVAGTDRIASAIDLLRDRPGRGYSLTDAVSFIVMREQSIGRALSLDADFMAEGFEVAPRR